MDILRTPDDVADGSPDYPTERRYDEIPAGDGQAPRVHRMVVSDTGLPWCDIDEPLPDVIEAYRAPDPHLALTIGSRTFTQWVPTRPDNAMYAANHEAWKVLDHWTTPVLTIFSDEDSVAPDGWKPIVARVPGAAGQPHVILRGGGHFPQEDLPDAYTDALLAWLGDPE